MSQKGITTKFWHIKQIHEGLTAFVLCSQPINENNHLSFASVILNTHIPNFDKFNKINSKWEQFYIIW